jgi:hypothetical protein
MPSRPPAPPTATALAVALAAAAMLARNLLDELVGHDCAAHTSHSDHCESSGRCLCTCTGCGLLDSVPALLWQLNTFSDLVAGDIVFLDRQNLRNRAALALLAMAQQHATAGDKNEDGAEESVGAATNPFYPE